MREILFRGKLTDNGDWIYLDMLGHITTHTGKISKYTQKTKYGESYYYYAYQLWNRIDHSTIGQYTGLKDKNGKKIFEGDIVRYMNKEKMVVVWNKDSASFAIAYSTINFNYLATISSAHIYLEVIGNIHDAPELLEVQNNG